MGSNTSWTPPPVPGGPTPEAPSGGSSGGDWSWGWLGQLFAQPSGTQARPGRGYYPGAEAQQQLENRPDPIGDWFKQQFSTSPEDALASQIEGKMGLGDYSPHDPTGMRMRLYIMAQARAAAHAAQNDPAYRQNLATAMGWNLQNGHVMAWIQQGGGLPDNPTGGASPAGATTGKTSTTSATTAAASTIGAPFDPSKWGGRASDPGFTYGAVLPPDIAAAAGVANQWGVDYALPEGTPQTSPFAGTVLEADFNGPYGNTVLVKLTNGFTYRVAHLASLGVVKGQAVNVGTDLGPTGSTGNSTGPHVLIEMRDATGKPIDPTPIIDGLLKGDSTGATKTLGDYATATANAPGPILTNDGHLLYPGSQDYDVFFAAQSLWRKRYGGDPPWSFVSSLIAAGNTTAGQIASQMDMMSSDITGMNWGQRDAFSTSVSNAALKAWNRPVPDSTLKMLADKGITDPGGIQGWVSSHPASSLDPAAYGQVFDATNPQTQQLWKQPPSPEMIKHIHDQMNQGPTTGA